MEAIAGRATTLRKAASVLVDATKPLLTLEELAHLLDRTPKGLSDTLHGNTPLGVALRAIRVKLGRRVYFRRDRLQELIDQATGLP